MARGAGKRDDGDGNRGGTVGWGISGLKSNECQCLVSLMGKICIKD